MINRKQLPYIDPQKWTQMIHMGYATEFVRLCNAEWDVDNPAPALLQPYLTAVLTAVAKEDQDYHVQQKSDLTPQIDEADKGRDGKLNQVLKMVDAMSVMTDMPQKQQAALTLKGPLDHYKPRADMAMSDETTQIQQWHEEFSASAAQQQSAQELGLTQIIADMMSETDRLVQLVAQRNIEMGNKREIQLTEDRQQTDLAIENFTQVLNALTVVDQDDERFNNIIDGLAGAQKTYRERYEEHARTVKRVKVASTVVGNHYYNTARDWSWERLLEDGKAQLAIDEQHPDRIVSTDKKALKAGGLVLALKGVPVKPGDDVQLEKDYELIPAEGGSGLGEVTPVTPE